MNSVTEWVRYEYTRPRFWYALTCGAGLGIGFIIPLFWWCVLPGIVGLLRVVRLSKSSQTVVWSMSVAWGVKYLCALSWYMSVYPIEWISGLPSAVQILVIGTYWITSALWLSVGGGVSAYGLYKLYHAARAPKFLWYILVPFIWLGGELVGALFFSMVTSGPGSFIQTYFSFGMVGYLLAETNLGIFVSGIQGVFGLSVGLVALCVGVLVASGFRRTQRMLVLVAGLCLFVVFHFMSGTGTPISSQGITVVSIDTTFDETAVATITGAQSRMTKLQAAISAAVATNPDFILLPEDSRYVATEYAGVSPQSALDRFLFTHGNTSVTLIDSGRVDMPSGDAYLRATLFDGKRKAVYQFDKQYLVPQGEYVPYLYAGVLRLLGFGSIVDGFERDSSYRPGPFTLRTEEMPAGIPGILFCFESVRPDGAISLVGGGMVPFILHPLSHGWFHQPISLWYQLDTMLMIQARVSGVPIVSAGNLVSGKLYLPNGAIETGEVLETGDQWLLRKFVF